MDQLPIFLVLHGRSVILLGDGEAAAAKRQLIERAGGNPVGEQDTAARIAFVALEDETEAVAAAARLKARGLLVNAVDRPALCDFTTPAIVDRHPVLVAIGTGGASAGLAKALRQRLEALLPASLGALATALSDAREAMRERWPGGGDRRRAIDAALQPGAPLDPLADHRAGLVAPWLASGGTFAESRVETVWLQSSDPDDMTLRQARLLAGADRVLHEPGVAAAIVARARADAMRQAIGTGEAAGDASGDGLTVVLRRG